MIPINQSPLPPCLFPSLPSLRLPSKRPLTPIHRQRRLFSQKEFERRVDPNDKNAQNLLDEMRQHVKKLEDMRKNEDPRLSFSTPEFKEAQRTFTDGFKKNFGKPVEWGLVKDYAWSTPQLRKLVRRPAR